MISMIACIPSTVLATIVEALSPLISVLNSVAMLPVSFAALTLRTSQIQICKKTETASILNNLVLA